MQLKKGYAALLAEANASVKTYTVAQLLQRIQEAPGLQLIDVRDARELEKEGELPGAFHAPRATLEFWVDPASPFFKPVFADIEKEYVFLCSGGWRSALAAKTLYDMGFAQVGNIEGGFTAWKAAGAPVNAPSAT
jgi:rhodanese-related sulfurtransferase